MRTIIEIPPHQLKALAEICEKENISRAELVRRALDRVIQENLPADKDASFGAWKHKRLNARQYVDSLRAEWDRR